MTSRQNRRQAGKPRQAVNAGPERLWIYGRHAVAAALANKDRRVRRVVATKNAADWLVDAVDPARLPEHVEDEKPAFIDRLLPPGAVHQGLAAEAFDLPRYRLKEVCSPGQAGRPVVVLDQITDPQNIGAIFRSAAAFGAAAIIVQERRTPPLSGALAKAAAGAIEIVPCVKAVNIARSIEALNDLGYMTIGLSGHTDNSIRSYSTDQPIALVLGAEGSGLRPLVSQSCTGLAKIPMAPGVESLNVSTAAAVALFAITAQS